MADVLVRFDAIAPDDAEEGKTLITRVASTLSKTQRSPSWSSSQPCLVLDRTSTSSSSCTCPYTNTVLVLDEAPIRFH